MSAPPAPPYAATREAWLLKAIDTYMRPAFAQMGHRLPDVIHVSVGFPRGKNQGETKDIPGETWSGMHSPDGNPHVYISPFVGDGVVALQTLLHECIHCLLDPDMSHGSGLGSPQDEPFRRIATELGLVGHMDATVADPALKAQFAELIGEPTVDPDGNLVGGELGPYPHPALELLPSLAVNDPRAVVTAGKVRARTTSGAARQKTRWVRVRCPGHPKAPAVNTSRSTILEGRAPLCGEPVLEFGPPTDPARLTELEQASADHEAGCGCAACAERATLAAPVIGERPCGLRMTAKVADDSGETGDNGAAAAEAS